MDLVPLAKTGRLWKSKADFFRPFRNAATDVGQNVEPLYDPSLAGEALQDLLEPDLRDLNSALEALVDVFPDVQPEVFREMLTSISGDSRLEVVTEHLLQKKAKWVRGRFRTPAKREITATRVKKRKRGDTGPARVVVDRGLDDEEFFRSEAYKQAVKQVLYQEFRNLSHSTVKGVLAEQNFSYTLARPILQQVANRSWRFSLGGLWPRKAAGAAAAGHPYVLWSVHAHVDGEARPAVKQTGSVELDSELYGLFVAPVLLRQRQIQIQADYSTACEVNEAEAEAVEALFDCECCFSSVPFEKIASCDESCHLLCLECVRRTVNEALYGQGWARTADLQRTSVRCFAPTTQDCHGSLSSGLVKRALTQDADNDDVWCEFQARVTTETLLKSGLPLQRCPFCSYAEIDEPPKVSLRHPMAIWHHTMTRAPPAFQIMFLSLLAALIFLTLPILCLVVSAWLFCRLLPAARSKLKASIARVHKKRRSMRFQCQNATCTRVSCTRCTTVWRDPHTCFESEKTSLRTAIEASATSAVKRTCPKCMLSFVKSSGCNKLVCNCGYTMCYICRQEISSREGYAHFCQHFRPSGGRCSECDRCDLYGDEDEDAAIRRAAEVAEKAWRDKEGGKDGSEEATKLMINALVGQPRERWYDEWLDAAIDAILD